MPASPRVLRVSSRALCHGGRPTLTIGAQHAPADWLRLWGKQAALECTYR